MPPNTLANILQVSYNEVVENVRSPGGATDTPRHGPQDRRSYGHQEDTAGWRSVHSRGSWSTPRLQLGMGNDLPARRQRRGRRGRGERALSLPPLRGGS